MPSMTKAEKDYMQDGVIDEHSSGRYVLDKLLLQTIIVGEEICHQRLWL